MLADMVTQKGTTEETIKVSGVSLTATKAQRMNDEKKYSLKDIFDAFSNVSNTTVAQPAQPSVVARG